MIDSMLGGLSLLFSGWTPLFLLAGCALGLIVGVLPALGATAGMSPLLPFIFGLDQASALALMIGMLATVATGDARVALVPDVEDAIPYVVGLHAPHHDVAVEGVDVPGVALEVQDTVPVTKTWDKSVRTEERSAGQRICATKACEGETAKV